MNNQSAVNWLKNELQELGDSENLIIDWDTFDQLIYMAVQKEKDQIIKAFNQDNKKNNGIDYYKLTYPDNKICKNCKHLFHMIGIGQGLKCSYLSHYKKSIPSIFHSCNNFEEK